MRKKQDFAAAQRFKNQGVRAEYAEGSGRADIWHHIAVVFTENTVIIYDNGQKLAEKDSSVPLYEILGGGSIWQIGKANWGNGEYYTGYLDNFKILGTAMTENEIKSEAEAYLGAALNVRKIQETIRQIDLIGLVEAKVDVRTKITQARELYDSLTEDEQALVSNIDTLVKDEEIYYELSSDAKAVLGEISFDNGADGLNSPGMAVHVNGTPVFVDDAERGKVLSLDGDGNVWFDVRKEDGSPLLTDVEELTVSYYSKAGRSNTNWAFYAAPDVDAQKAGNEYYIGILENGGKVKAERYLNGRQEVPEAACGQGWNHIVVVYGAENIKIYVNGVLTKTAANAGALKEILGTESILQIGKANWGDGEYYKGFMDDFSIYNYAFTERDIKILEGVIANPRPIKEKIVEAKAVNQEHYTKESCDALQEAIKTARVKVLAIAKFRVKASEGRKFTVSWKKIKGAKGYVVYTSAKKNEGFKAVKAMKNATKVKVVLKAEKRVKK